MIVLFDLWPSIWGFIFHAEDFGCFCLQSFTLFSWVTLLLEACLESLRLAEIAKCEAMVVTLNAGVLLSFVLFVRFFLVAFVVAFPFDFERHLRWMLFFSRWGFWLFLFAKFHFVQLSYIVVGGLFREPSACRDRKVWSDGCDIECRSFVELRALCAVFLGDLRGCISIPWMLFYTTKNTKEFHTKDTLEFWRRIIHSCLTPPPTFSLQSFFLQTTIGQSRYWLRKGINTGRIWLYTATSFSDQKQNLAFSQKVCTLAAPIRVFSEGKSFIKTFPHLSFKCSLNFKTYLFFHV